MVIRSASYKRYPDFQNAHSTSMVPISPQPVLAWFFPGHAILLALGQVIKIPRDEAYSAEGG